MISCGANGYYYEMQWSHRKDVDIMDANKWGLNDILSITIKALI
jgi:hypothetical protein